MPRRREPPAAVRPERVISGGQTGVDRAALDVAIALGIRHGGWCPRGRLAEDGRIPIHYTLEETATSDYAQRTEQNVLAADATLILYAGLLRGGTLLTQQLAARHGKPCLAVDLDATPRPTAAVRRWLAKRAPGTLNVAGPRQSQSPGIAERARAFLLALWQQT